MISKFEDHFGKIEDPRIGNRKIHPLINVIFITLVGVLCGLNTFVEIEELGKGKIEFLKKYLDLTHGIPSHDTFGNVFALIDSGHFAECFENWSSSLRTLMNEDFIALDGKSIRSSLDKNKNKLPIHLMNVWSSMNSICLAQMRCDNKSNEVIAFEQLLEKLSLEECTITADAMHCHRETTRQITEAKANYVLGLKKNEPKMYSYCADRFNDSELEIEQIIKSENKHGRQEQRTIDFIKIDSCDDEIFDGWQNINGFVKIKSCRTENNKTTEEIRYYITSLDDIEKAAKGVRYHWQIENNLHWVLDNTFSEDKCRVRCENAGENMAFIRKIVLNMLNNNTTPKISKRRMMLKAILNEKYLETLLESF